MKWLITYFKKSWEEIQKVVWPTREEAVRLTIAVVVFSVVFAMITGIFDYILTEIIQRFFVN